MMSTVSGKKEQGFSLIEVMLVLVIVSSLMIMLLNFSTRKADELRINKTVSMYQQFQTAVLASYLTNGTWPQTCRPAQDNGTPLPNSFWTNYLPGWKIPNPYGSGYTSNCTDTTFYILMSTKTPVNAFLIASRLSGAFVVNKVLTSYPPVAADICSAAADINNSSCQHVVATVTIPGQNLNNARSVNFAGVYHSGACVPAPVCPSGMKPAIYVMPTSVSGVNDEPTGCGRGTVGTDTPSSCNINIYPVSSFSAFARGDTNGNPVASTGSGSGLNAKPLDCAIQSTPVPVDCNTVAWADLPDTEPTGTSYWRVCLAVITEKGLVNAAYGSSPTDFNYNQGRLMGSIAAFTRCVPNNGAESPAGSGITVWSPNAYGQP